MMELSLQAENISQDPSLAQNFTRKEIRVPNSMRRQTRVLEIDLEKGRDLSIRLIKDGNGPCET